jgi:hypothetical protein
VNIWNLAIVIKIASQILFGWLFIINDPMFIINNILIQVLFTTFQSHVDKPLVCNLIELHFMLYIPLVHWSANLYSLIFRTSVMQHECLGFFIISSFVECTNYGVDFHHSIWGLKVEMRKIGFSTFKGWSIFVLIVHLICGSLVDITIDFLFFFISEYFLNYA